MLRDELTPKKTASIVGAVVLACLLIFTGFRLMGARTTQAEEKHMEWQRDREMGIPDLGIRESATEEEKEIARTQALERRMTQQRESVTPTGY